MVKRDVLPNSSFLINSVNQDQSYFMVKNNPIANKSYLTYIIEVMGLLFPTNRLVKLSLNYNSSMIKF